MTQPGSLVDLDPLAEVLAWLSADEAVLTELLATAPGGATLEEQADRIVGDAAPPYPCLRVIDTPGGSMRDLTWIIDHEIQLEAWDDEAGSHGETVLGRLLKVAILSVKRMEQRDVTAAQAVVSHVSGGQPIPLPDPSGQPRVLTNLALTCHPPRAVPA